MPRRILSAIAVVVASMLVSGSLVTFVYGRGLPFALGPMGTLAHVPALALFVALLWAALTRVRKLDRDRTGLVWARDESLQFVGSFFATCVWLTTLVFVAGALVGAPLALSARPVSVVALLLAALSFVGSSAVQQLSTQSLVVASSPDEGPSRAGFAIATLVFVLAHVGVSSSWMYLPNVALFGLATSLLFASGPRPRYGLPIGVHAGWNFTQVALLGAPFGATHSETAVFRWPSGAPSVFGQSNGMDEGALFTVAVVPWVLFALWRRARTGSTQHT